MKKFYFLLFLIWNATNVLSQIPQDSLYLGKIPPNGVSPKVFFSGRAERVAITPNGEEIYCDGNYKVTKFKYSLSGWDSPVDIFTGYGCPGLTVSGDTIFIQNGTPISYYATRNGTDWNTPIKFWSSSSTTHYLQKSALGNYFATTNISTTGDISRFIMNSSDTALVAFNPLINNSNNGVDYFMARDESYMIFVIRNIGFGQGDLNITFKKPDGSWTNPKNLGAPINSSGWEWGPYVSPDEKYLFYTRDNNILWARIDSLIDSLKHTNYPPFVKNAIPDQVDSVNYEFNFTFSDSTFYDDDENDTLTFSVTLANGNNLPAWLDFNAATRTFSGMPDALGTYTIKVIATDPGNATAFCSFNLVIDGPSTFTDVESLGIRIYPNPSAGNITVKCENIYAKKINAEVYDLMGYRINILEYFNPQSVNIDLSGNPSGYYILKLTIDKKYVYNKFYIE